MIKIGITGGIGSGKTTVSKVWQSLGAYLINADVIAKQLMMSDDVVKRKLIESFGKKSFYPNGKLNRTYLADEAFSKGRVEELNSIVHPAVFEETDRLIERAEQQEYKAIIYEAAILLQHGRPEKMDYIILILADEQKRIKWVSRRDEAGRGDVMNRIKRQQDFDTLASRADVIIHNKGSLKKLKRKAEALYRELIEGSF